MNVELQFLTFGCNLWSGSFGTSVTNRHLQLGVAAWALEVALRGASWGTVATVAAVAAVAVRLWHAGAPA